MAKPKAKPTKQDTKKKPARPLAKKSAVKKSAPKQITTKAKPTKKTAPKKPARAKQGGALNAQELLRDKALKALDNGKAEDVVCIDVRELSSFTDFLIIATGRSNRQVKSLAQMAHKAFVEGGVKQVPLEGLAQGDWAVVDGGDVIVHLFRPEVRAFYRLEEVWGLEPPLQETFRNL